MSDSNAVQLGRFISQARSRPLPDDVVEAARLCLCDWVGVAIGARNESAGAIVRQTVEQMGAPGTSTVLFGQPTSPALAALANGTLAHCLDFDDTHISATTHTSAPVWAATIAMAEALNASEGDMLHAFVTGFEVSARIGRGMGQTVTDRGLHSTGVFGRIGAAAAAATLLRLDEEQAQHALAAAATQSGGLTASFGTMAKPYHAGKAAMDGVLAAQLSANGFVAAPGVLETGGGLDTAVVQDRSAQIAPFDDSRWEILRNSFKPYAACHLTHPAIDAARSAGVSLTEFVSARLRVSPLAQKITGGTDGRPSTPLAAKFDLKYCTAMALNAQTLSANDFEEPWAIDPATESVATRIETQGEQAIGYASAILEVTTRTGPLEIEIPVAKGHPGNPMGWADMGDKFEGLVAAKVGDKWTDTFGHLREFGAEGTFQGVRDALRALS